MITHARLIELLSYDPTSGVFVWNVSRGNAKRGDTAGHIHTTGYLKIKIEGQLYFAHRLAWFYVHKEWPQGELDHRNGNPSDNRLSELRLATRTQNHANGRRPLSASGLRGVKRDGKRWSARVRKNRKEIHIGTFDTKEEAHAAYVAKTSELFGDFAFTNRNGETVLR